MQKQTEQQSVNPNSFRLITTNLFYSLLILVFAVCVSAEERILYQSQFKDALDWKPSNQPGKSMLGWQGKASEGVYSTCDVQSLSDGKNLANSLVKNFSKSAEVPKIHLEADLRIRSCAELNPKGPKIPGCKEIVKVVVNYLEISGSWKTLSYEQLENDLNVKTIQFPDSVTQYSISLVDEGVCADLSNIKILIYVCPSTTNNLIEFKQTTSGITAVKTEAQCVQNAQSIKPFSAFCLASGIWKKTAEYCFCEPGFEPDLDRKSCRGCVPGTYKSREMSNDLCQKCPMNSYSSNSQSSICQCNVNYARRNGSNAHEPCYQQPEKPKSVEARGVTSSQAILFWKRPEIALNAGSGPVWYCVYCDEPEDKCRSFSNIRTNDTQLTIETLHDDTTFTWNICSENAVSKYMKRDYNCQSVQFHTPKMMRVQNPSIETFGERRLALVWNEPPGISSSQPRYYKVKIQKEEEVPVYTDIDSSKDCFEGVCTYPLPQTMPSGSYKFQVGVGDPAVFSEPPLHVPINSNVLIKGEIRRLMITVGLLFAVLLMILASCIAIFCCCRQKIDQTYPRNHHKSLGNYYAEQYTTIAPPTMNEYSLKMAGYGGAFLEPTAHLDPETLLCKYARELNDEQVASSFQSIKGKFSEAVELGTLWEDEGFTSKVTVGLQHFVPTPSSYRSSDSNSTGGVTGAAGVGGVASTSMTNLDQNSLNQRRDLILAAATCAQLIHPNVLSLKGFIRRNDESLTIVTEHAELGSLITLLQQGHVSDVSQIVHMARGIACGMRYLQEEGYIHKVLKSSNILVNQNLVCKISGFTQRVKIEAQQKNANLVIPEDLVPWTAPEVLIYQQFTWASDVWSFGIVLWEMLSQGCTPYYDQEIPSTQILSVLEAGHRLPPPVQCPQLAYDLMTQCWNGEGNRRPQFASIVQVLETLMKKPLDTLNQEFASYDPTNQWYVNANMTLYNKSIASPSTFRRQQQHQNTLLGAYNSPASLLSAHLAQLKLSEYENLFLMSGITTIEDMSRLTAHDLKAIGITSSKHRKRIMQSFLKLANSTNQCLNIDVYSQYGGVGTNSTTGKCWNNTQLSPGPREQLMSQFV